MTRQRLLTAGVLVLLSLTAHAKPELQYVLVLCSEKQCDYHTTVAVLFQGKPSVRLAKPPLVTVSPSAVESLPEIAFERLPGLYRDPKSGIMYGLDAEVDRHDIALPLRLPSKMAMAPGVAWQGATITYVTASGKTRATSTATVDNLAYLLVSSDAELSMARLLQYLLNQEETDPRRLLLIQGALKATAKPATLQKWRESLMGRIVEYFQRFDGQTGDPATLTDALHEAVQLKSVYVPVSDDPASKAALARVDAADDLFHRRLAAADALRDASLWDEYLVKLRQLGLARWSMPDVLAHVREAETQSARSHQTQSVNFAKAGHLDRAFDEAELAARNSCDPADLNFQQARTALVYSNEIPLAMEYSGLQKVNLEQIVRGLDQLDPNKEGMTLNEIRRGEAFDPTFLPLQWKKADFLDKLGKYTEALAVLERIERNVRLDPKQLEVCLGLDGHIRNNLLDAIEKSRDETAKAFNDGRYQDALTAAARGLRADPTNAELLYSSALSAAFLRQIPAATTYIRTYLGSANMTCKPSDGPEKILELYRLIGTPAVRPAPADSIPNWVSGMRYQLTEAFYDPISLGFLQPIDRIINQHDGVATLFRREDRSYLVNYIVTARTVLGAGAGSTGATTTIFDAEPTYDRQTLSMLEIGPKATSASIRTTNRLAYLNSPFIDPGLVLKFTGKQVARGWAGNPFFNPFVWNGFYLFDLTYDKLGRVIAATPIADEAGARPDPFSEPLQFTWYNDTKMLVSIQGTRSGYIRQLNYDKTGMLASETITFPKGGKGLIQYTYLPDSQHLSFARVYDNFWDKSQRMVYFDWAKQR